MENLLLISFVVIAVVIAAFFVIPIYLRVVVPTNEVHIVQSGKKSLSYGKDLGSGNAYYAWPSWIPVIGVVTSKFTLSVFAVNLDNYEAYDSGRLPFVIDIKSFFRISDPVKASERVNTFGELREQLQSILQGAVRSILAKNELEAILSERGSFGEQFTKEVAAQLGQWGCETVKNIEFMDIRDSKESKVIKQIMEKKQSQIDMESRRAVAENKKLAEIAEIEGCQAAEIKQQESQEAVGIRTAQKMLAVGVSEEKSQQEIKEQAKLTAEKEMSVARVQSVQAAEIDKQVKIVIAEQEKQSLILKSEADLQAVKLAAEGVLISAENQAKATQKNGAALAEAEKLMQLAGVDPQITLATAIGANAAYQGYLVQIREIEKSQVVGVEQAKALQAAGIKIIANTGDVNGGVKNVMELFSAKGGLSAGAALEAFANTEQGGRLLGKFGLTVDAAKKMMGDDVTKEA